MFKPQYHAKNPQEQGELEDSFLQFVNHVSLENVLFFGDSQDCKVNVSQREGVTYIEPAGHWAMIKEGSVAVSSTGKDGRKAEVITKYTTERKYNSGSLRASQNLEIIIGREKYILPTFSCTLA